MSCGVHLTWKRSIFDGDGACPVVWPVSQRSLLSGGLVYIILQVMFRRRLAASVPLKRWTCAATSFRVRDVLEVVSSFVDGH